MSSSTPRDPVPTVDWKHALLDAERRAKATVTGVASIAEVWHGKLVTIALDAFGDDSRTTLHIEGTSAKAGIRRPDLILMHPDVGVIIIENKGIRLADVTAVDACVMSILYPRGIARTDPFKQAEGFMFALRDLVKRRIEPGEVMFLRTAALPRIGREAFESHFGKAWPDETLFAEQCATGEAFGRHLLDYAASERRRLGRTVGITNQAAVEVTRVLDGKGFLHVPRRPADEGMDPRLLGAQIQATELGLKHPTSQQKALGRADFRGNHRLFRGVAGSGKSVLLAVSIAATLNRWREEAGTLFGPAPTSRRVLVACFNKTLVPYLRERIEDRFGRLAWEKPTPESLRISHFEGIVKGLERADPSLKTGLDFHKKSERARRMLDALAALPADRLGALQYDAVYVDEAQDLEPDEMRLLKSLARPDPATGAETFVIFYDNAQNIYGVKPPVWQELGINIVGRTDFLDQCLRNTAQTIDFAFNVLVGSHAAEGRRVATRTFADVGSLRGRGLVEEVKGEGGASRFATKFAPRQGAPPVVTVYPNRAAEVAGAAETVRRWVHEQRVEPSDILVIYYSHVPYYAAGLPEALRRAVGASRRVRFVDKANERNKDELLQEEGALTVSTIASAKGYDAPVVLLLGADRLDAAKVADRALFYVGATRAKLLLHVTGTSEPGRAEEPLLDEIARAAGSVLDNGMT